MRKRFLSFIICLLFSLSICCLVAIAVTQPELFVSTTQEFENTYANTGDGSVDIINVAATQIGYIEINTSTGEPLYNGNGKWYSKYGDRFGDSAGAWCAYFVMWCAEQANVPKTVIPQARAYGNCGTFVNWFKSAGKWKDVNEYVPSTGDIVFFDWENDGTPSHVGIVSQSLPNGTIETIEGNVSAGLDGTLQSPGYYQVVHTIRKTDNILGYGTYDFQGDDRLNGIVNNGGSYAGKAYMLPNTDSETVWYVDTGDRCEVLCKDGNYYLLLYPFLATGKYVAAYVPASIVDLNGEVLSSNKYYSINKEVVLKEQVILYHNASTQSLIGNSGKDNKIRATLEANDVVRILFEKDDFYFVKTDSVSGFAEKNKIDLQNVPSAEDDPPDTPDPQESFIPGDTDGDGKLSEIDGQLILKYSAKLIQLTDEQLLRADADGNGKVNAADAAKIFIYLKNSND